MQEKGREGTEGEGKRREKRKRRRMKQNPINRLPDNTKSARWGLMFVRMR